MKVQKAAAAKSKSERSESEERRVAELPVLVEDLVMIEDVPVAVVVVDSISGTSNQLLEAKNGVGETAEGLLRGAGRSGREASVALLLPFLTLLSESTAGEVSNLGRQLALLEDGPKDLMEA